MRFSSPLLVFCFLSTFCGTSLVPLLQFQVSARFKVPPRQLSVFVVLPLNGKVSEVIEAEALHDQNQQANSNMTHRL